MRRPREEAIFVLRNILVAGVPFNGRTPFFPAAFVAAGRQSCDNQAIGENLPDLNPPAKIFYRPRPENPTHCRRSNQNETRTAPPRRWIHPGSRRRNHGANASRPDRWPRGRRRCPRAVARSKIPRPQPAFRQHRPRIQQHHRRYPWQCRACCHGYS